jgi:poly(hydroxyalkanoate) depolymerase family esterase
MQPQRRHHDAPTIAGQLERIESFAPNPGALNGHVYLPQNLQPGAPLVVVLHGCTQSAVDYASAAGWLELADRHCFAVLLPQQQRTNNANLCFNWFERGDVQRDQGEAASIKSMIDHVAGGYNIDSAKIFITGLSAGAAMAGAMLACYPEVFAGGGLIAGLPHGTASSITTAFHQMRGGPRKSGPQLGASVMASSDHKGPWPRISIWHGDSDRTVNAINGDASLSQWLSVHGLADSTPNARKEANVSRRTWSDDDGRVKVEHVKVGGMGHGTPIDLRQADAVGKAVPFVLDAGIASSEHLLDFWGISDLPERKPMAERRAQPIDRPIPPTARKRQPVGKLEVGVEKIINDALRAAGLMK